MTRAELIKQIKAKGSFLCVGLDTDIQLIPEHLKTAKDPVFEFNKAIIDATKEFCVAYKPNLAFYESLGPSGWESLKKTLDYIPNNIFTIADAKRGDIGNTSALYARTFFETYNFDSITVAPYMGHDSVTPFLKYKEKWVIVLGLTSNEGAMDFQFLPLELSKQKVFEKVISKSASWGNIENMMFVIGATRADMFKKIRIIIPDHFLLVPGVGAQGGSLKEVAENGMNKDCGLLVNSSRGIIYASSGKDFADLANLKAQEIRNEMSAILKEKGVI